MHRFLFSFNQAIQNQKIRKPKVEFTLYGKWDNVDHRVIYTSIKQYNFPKTKNMQQSKTYQNL